MKSIILLIGTVTVLFACNKDVDGLLLKGTPVTYAFSNDSLNADYQVDESLLDQFGLTLNEDGTDITIECLYIGDQSKIATDTVFLYLHGNAGNMNLFWEAVAKMANYGHQHRFGVMMFDYRGFGNSTGQSENIETMNQDVELCIEWLKSKGLTEDRLVLYGYSLGTLSGSHVAGSSPTTNINKLVIEAPQTSANTLIQDATGLSLSATTVSDFGYDIPGQLRKYDQSVLWIHGTADETASYSNFSLFWEDYTNPKKEAFILEGAGHAIADDIGFEKMQSLVLQFIK